MTPQEAIDFFESFLKLIPANPYKESAECSIIALKKQIPKKVNNLEVFSDIGACIPKTKSGNCPICNDFMVGEQGDHKLKELQSMINNQDPNLMKDIELLEELEFNLRHGKVKIVEV